MNSVASGADPLTDGLFETGRALIQSVDPDGRFLYTNRRWRAVLGYSVDEIKQLRVFDVLHPDCLPHCYDLFERLMSGAEDHATAEVTFVARNGHRVPCTGSVAVNREDDRLLSTQGVFVELSGTQSAGLQTDIFEMLYSHPGLGFVMTDADGTIELFNRCAQETLGYSGLEIIGQRRFPSLDAGSIQSAAVTAQEGSGSPALDMDGLLQATSEHRNTDRFFHRKDGSKVPLVTSISRLSGDGDELAGYAVILRDASQRYAAEQRAGFYMQLGTLFRDLVNMVDDPVYVLDPQDNYRFTYVNDATCRHYRMDREKLTELSPVDFDPNTDVTALDRIWQRLKAGERVSLETLHRRDEALVPVIVTGSLIENGERRLIAGFIHDITERVEAEVERRQQDAFNLAVIENAGAAVIATDPEGRVQLFNHEAGRLLGCTAPQVINGLFPLVRTAPDRLAPASVGSEQERTAFFHELTAPIQHGHSQTSEWKLTRAAPELADREDIYLLLDVSVALHDNGAIVGYLVLGQDISLLKRTQRELAEQVKLERTSRQELERSNAELEQFAYVASHDLQEPLRAVGSCVQLLVQRLGGLDERSAQLAQHAVDGATRMRGLIEALLAFSRVGSRENMQEIVNCNEAFERALAGLAVSIEESGATVTRSDLPVVLANAKLVQQLFQNLIGNAIKFRGERPPEVRVDAVWRGAEGLWEFTVADNGIGLEAEFAERIFGMFQRLHPRDTYPGMGIGLAICRKIVTLFGGSIRARSGAAGGAVFVFTLPGTKENLK